MSIRWLTISLLILVVLSAIPVASARIIEVKDGYIVSTVDDPFIPSALDKIKSGAINQDQTDYYLTEVPQGKTTFFTDLTWWGDPYNTLSLRIQSPDGIFGPFYDMSDGKNDSRIYLRTRNDRGLAEGSWSTAVSGYRVNGTASYALITGSG